MLLTPPRGTTTFPPGKENDANININNLHMTETPEAEVADAGGNRNDHCQVLKIATSTRHSLEMKLACSKSINCCDAPIGMTTVQCTGDAEIFGCMDEKCPEPGYHRLQVNDPVELTVRTDDRGRFKVRCRGKSTTASFGQPGAASADRNNALRISAYRTPDNGTRVLKCKVNVEGACEEDQGFFKSFHCPARDQFTVHDTYAGDGTGKTDVELFKGESVTTYLSGSSDASVRLVDVPSTLKVGRETKQLMANINYFYSCDSHKNVIHMDSSVVNRDYLARFERTGDTVRMQVCGSKPS